MSATHEEGSHGCRWSGFVADGDGAKALHEVGNPDHRIRVEHDRDGLFINLSDEDGTSWTVIAIDRSTEPRRPQLAGS